MWKEIIFGKCNFENGKYLVIIVECLAITCDEIINDSASTNITNTVSKTFITKK